MLERRLKHLTFGIGIVVLQILGGVPARAAATADAVPESNELQEVIVTSEKRDVSIMKAPLSVTALAPETLAGADITQLNQLDGYVPGLVAARNGGLNQIIAIRGVGYQATQTGSQPGVSYHVDGVYIVSPIAVGVDLLDIERLEVLRGPQGTIFGQNSTGGAINAISKKPSLDSVSGEESLSYGNYNLVKAFSAVNLPLSDDMALRAAIQYYRHDGFTKDVDLRGYSLDDANRINGRLSFLWKASDDLAFTLSAQLFNAEEHGSAQKNIDDPNGDPRRLSQDYPGQYHLNFSLLSAEVVYSLPWATLKSTTAFQSMQNVNQVDRSHSDSATLGYYDVIPQWDNSYQAITQEFNLTGSSERVDWIAGMLLLWDYERETFVEFAGSGAVPTTFDNSNTLPLAANLNYRLDARIKHTSAAPFGQVTFKATDRFRVTAGVRYNYDRTSSYSETDLGAYTPGARINVTDRQLSGKVEADFDVNAENMLYASISRGFKPSGANLITTPALVPFVYKPELVTAFEVGAKSKLLNNRLAIRVAGFYYHYDNFQYQEEDPVPYNGAIANIPRAEIWGGETELEYKIVPALRFNANLTSLVGHFIGNYNALDAVNARNATVASAALGYGPFDAYTIAARAAAAQNTNGNVPPMLPKIDGSVGLTYDLDLGDAGTLASHVQYLYRGKYVYRIFNDGALDDVPSYATENVDFEYRPPAGRWKYRFAVTNVSNKAGINSRFTDPYSTHEVTTNEYIPPRQFIGTASFSF